MTGDPRGEVGEVKRLDRESTCANVVPGRNKMLRKTSLVLAIAAALMLPSASFGKGGDHRVGYHGRYYRHGVWGHCWPGGVWRYSGGWLGYGCWRWTPIGSLFVGFAAGMALTKVSALTQPLAKDLDFARVRGLALVRICVVVQVKMLT